MTEQKARGRFAAINRAEFAINQPADTRCLVVLQNAGRSDFLELFFQSGRERNRDERFADRQFAFRMSDIADHGRAVDAEWADVDRLRIVREEEREAIKVWTEMPTTINGLPTKLLASQKWGVVMLGDRPVALDQYPLQKLNGIQASHPICEQRTINAKFRCGSASQDKLSFEPVERQHQFDDGRITELVNISVNLDDEIRKSMGIVNVGDVKDFTLEVQILAGFEAPAASSSAVRSAAAPA